MNLAAQLSQQLDISTNVTLLKTDTSAVLDDMTGITLPDLGSDLLNLKEHHNNIDLSLISQGIRQATSTLDPLLNEVPLPGDALNSIEQAIALAEQFANLELSENIKEISTLLDEQLDDNGNYLDKLDQLVAALSSQGGLSKARDLFNAFAELSGSKQQFNVQLPPLIPAIQSAVGTFGGLATLDQQLNQGAQLARTINRQLDAGNISAGVAQVERQLGIADALPLAHYIRQLDVDDNSQIEAAKQAINNAIPPVNSLSQAIAEGMAFGQASLLQLDAPALSKSVQQTTTTLGAIDLSPLEKAIASLAEPLTPLFQNIDLSLAPANNIDQWLTELETKVATIAAGINQLDIQQLSAPVTRGLNTILALPQQLTQALQGIKLVTIEALNKIRQVVDAIPLDTIADAIRQVLTPITALLEFVTSLVNRIEAILSTALAALQQALGSAETAIDTLTDSLERLFGKARQYIEKLNLTTLVGELAENIEQVAQLLNQADMSPYFGSVVDGLNTTTGVIDKVPFDMLPDNMEQDVVDLVKPIKALDAEEVQNQIKSLLQIGADGKFELRDDLVSALAQLQQKFDALITAVEERDPRLLLTDIDTELGKLSDKINGLTPELSLEPVQEVIATLRQQLAKLDMDQALKPLTDGYDQLEEHLESYQPDKLLGPINTKITQARDNLFDHLALDRWQEQLTALRTQALAVIDPLDPAQLEPQLQALVSELQSQSANLPDVELGDLLASLVSGLFGGNAQQSTSNSIGRIVQWLQGDSGTKALSALARQAANDIQASLTAVNAIQPQQIVQRLAPSIHAIHDAISSLPDSQAKNELADCAKALDITSPLTGFEPLRQAYLAELNEANASMLTLANEGLSQVDIAVRRLAGTLEPLSFLRRFWHDLLGILGINHQSLSLQAIINEILSVATPARLAALLTPVMQAFKDKTAALLDGFLEPVLAAISDLQALKTQLSLEPLIAEISHIYQEAKNQLFSLHPDQLLGETITALNHTKGQLGSFDPLAPINAALTALQQSSGGILEKLDVNTIFQAPLATYDEILDALKQLDIQKLLQPLLDVLDTIATNVDRGLEETATAVTQLQAALPDSVGSSGNTASASFST